MAIQPVCAGFEDEKGLGLTAVLYLATFPAEKAFLLCKHAWPLLHLVGCSSSGSGVAVESFSAGVINAM